ncbi:MAG: hypothetical protein AUG75_09075 [Cyanobacteria bacterium 13_1_20CM_4_61_6]|nr:MAG: hypothetical protein AUG75_09075 [Cyanobacteria bacterium 13_1_20CM_4_61_6]
MSTQGTGLRIAAWILTVLITLLFIFSATGKLVGAQPVVQVFEQFGLRNFMLLIGVGELVSALLFLIPRTNSLGLLLLSSYLGGAIVTQMQHGQPFIAPAILLLLVWIAGYLRHPEVLRSFRSADA